ncbi:formate dehydrogenase accessory sulfurtransferase FdhD [Alphaproteobacteria bacterium]|jgi:FdhD protein|nr:formate dehydrogenase accessory sulfurtransferase FdhD [Alphaproteobacteria bacterium]MDA9816343.1 formate dehydrogenase accessory sulfurtransferase FdhD [Alphaproteobacteria bacterium]MDC0394942.1 formate dehydrogenase accessory sulfurtransferase FdhD [Alphaproteobacteria bacterium]MDC3311824.1 formate dehydrogenase accessory sulfurtransferase FdhD [Alphaproteobacteria bacterium]
MVKSRLYIGPNLDTPGLTTELQGVDASGQNVQLPVVSEKAVTIFLNNQEIVTAMTLGDYLEELAVGFLFNQNMITKQDKIEQIEYDEELSVIIVRTDRKTNFEEKLQSKIRTSGCAQGTIYGDMMDKFESIVLPKKTTISTSQIINLSRKINTTPSLYLKAGAIHGCVLAVADEPMIYMEDIGRHNAVDKISGVMFKNKIQANDKVFYTTGRLTSEMVLKTVIMGVPILISRSGFTEAGVSLARMAGLTLIGRARGSKFVALSGNERIIFDANTNASEQINEQRSVQGRFNDA